jgi:Zn-dependent oligopeptidase
MRLVASAVLVAVLAPGVVPATAAVPPASPAAALDLSPAPEKIAADCSAAIAGLKTKIDSIAAVPPAQRTFATVPLAYSDAAGAAFDAIATDLLMGDVGPAKPQRDAAASCGVALSKFVSEQGARPDLYAALADADRSGTAATPAQKKLLSDAAARR